jgi:hypothetical protein
MYCEAEIAAASVARIRSKIRCFMAEPGGRGSNESPVFYGARRGRQGFVPSPGRPT